MPEILEGKWEERPWGRFKVLFEETGVKVKIIEVNTGCRLSYQSHVNRDENWIVFQGEGAVLIDDKEIPLKAGDTARIARSEKHRAVNTGNVVFRFIEVQIGEYLGEDDIERFEDDYGRI